MRSVKTWIIIGIIAILLTIGYILLWKAYVSIKKELRDTRIELSVKTGEVQTYRDKNGNLHARVDQYEKNIHELETTYDSIENKLYLNYKAAGMKDKQIESLRYALFESRDSLFGLEILLENQDSLAVNDILVHYKRHIKFDNGNLKADVIVPLDPKYPYALVYNYTTECYMTERWYRPKSDFFLWKWMGITFKKKVNEFDFRVSDSNATIKLVRDIQVE